MYTDIDIYDICTCTNTHIHTIHIYTHIHINTFTCKLATSFPAIAIYE